MHVDLLKRIVIRGFKSISECDLELKELNVLIGPNGAGKSNFLSFFRLIQSLLEKQLQIYISKQGGPDALLHFGRKKTEKLSAELYFGDNSYQFALEPTNDNRMMFVKERILRSVGECNADGLAGGFETSAEYWEKVTPAFKVTFPIMENWRLYHFHDTSESALIKGISGIDDNEYLRPDARNLAPFLYLLQHQYKTYYERIVKTIRLVAPFFGDFHLRHRSDNKDKIELEWTEKGEDIPFKAKDLSDGTLRFICLATALMQPEKLQPTTILIDEPELGLHPFAIQSLGALVRSASKTQQIILSTQSTDLLNEFTAEDVIVADRTESGTYLHRLDAASLTTWLEDYSLGDLWQKNLLGGRPSQ